MTNDTTTLNGALAELGETMADNLTTQGVTSSASEGLTTLAEKILDIEGGGGNSIVVMESDTGEFNLSRLTSTGSYGLTVNVPSGYTSLGQYCFYSNYAVKEVNLPSTISSLSGYVFYSTQKLESVDLSSTAVTSLPNYLFYACYELDEVKLPEGLQTIGSYVFYNCTSLETLKIPSTVTSIGGQFIYTSSSSSYPINLDTLYFEGSTPPNASSTTFSNLPTSCVISVPCGSLEAYTTKQYYPSSSTYTYVERCPYALVFSSSSYTANSQGSVTVSVTLTNEGEPYASQSISFTDGTSTVTATTNSSGVATATFNSFYSHDGTVTATYNTVSESVAIVGTHDYTLAFSQDTYVAESGSATLELSLLDRNVAISNATVSVVGSDSSSYSCITNSSGVGTVTVSNISSDTSFTASYDGVSATCTVSVSSYLFYDDCSINNTSNYTTFYEMWDSKTNVNLSLSFNTDHYVLTNGNSSFGGVCLYGLQGADNYVLSADIKPQTSSSDSGGGVGIITQKDRGYCLFQPNSISTKHLILNNYAGAVASNVAVSNFNTTDYNRFELTKQGRSITIKIYNGDTQLFSKTQSLSSYSAVDSAYPAISVAKSCSVWVKNIKVESL